MVGGNVGGERWLVDRRISEQWLVELRDCVDTHVCLFCWWRFCSCEKIMLFFAVAKCCIFVVTNTTVSHVIVEVAANIGMRCQRDASCCR